MESIIDGFHVLFMIGIVASGAQYSALLVPFIIAVFFTLQMFYLRTSRQLRLLDIEAAAPLYTLFTETSTHGLEHIRAFGWQIDFTKETYHALDYSQRPYYYMNAIQRWLQLSMDLVGLFIALIIISTTLSFRQTTSQAGLGLSLLYLVDLSHMLKGFVSAWTDLETSLGALARLRTFLNSTPQESESQDGVKEGTTEKQALIGSPNDEGLPPQWPQSGNVQFTSVNAKYQ
jgi:ABC-type multidrug transport system fused ATPase/permease subunit